MTKIVRLTESDLTRIVKRVIFEEKRNVKHIKPIHVLFEEIDSMLNFYYKTNSAFLRHAKSFEKRFNILENVKINLVENLFSNNRLILEKFDRLTNKKVITESEFNFQSELNGYFNFIRNSLLYQGGFINESQYNNHNLLTEAKGDWGWDSLTSAVSSGVSAVGGAVKGAVKGAVDAGKQAVKSGTQAVKQAVKSGTQAVKSGAQAVKSAAQTGAKVVTKGAQALGQTVSNVAQKGYAALQGAWNKLKATGLGPFMEGYRSFLTSNYGAALQILIEVSTEGFGAVVPVIAWALLLQYDQANLAAGVTESINWFNLIFSIIGTATTGLASKAIGAAMPFFKAGSKAAGSIGQAIEWLAKSKFGKFFEPFVAKISAGLGKIPGLIAKAMTWVEAVFGKVFGKGVVNFFKKGATFISKSIGEFAASMTKWFKKDVVQGSKKLATKGLQKVFSSAATLSPKLEAYLASAAGQRLAPKLSSKSIDYIKKELTSTLKGYNEEQALAYIDKKYGKLYGDVLRLAKTTKDIKKTGKDITKSVKNWKATGQNLKAPVDLSAQHFKDVVSKTQGLVQKTAKAGELGAKVTTEV